MSDVENLFRPYKLPFKDSIEYVEFECAQCGETARNTYCEPSRSQMKSRRLCFHCNYWKVFEDENDVAKMTIISGHVYSPGNRTSGALLGMAGRRFDIEYIAPSIYAGQRCTTFDLWSGSDIPEHLLPKFPDTARFLGGTEKADASGITCWNPSDRKAEPYPLPRALKPKDGGPQ
jgi:hypothetical protein